MKNKVVWITGASSGIGEALAYQLNELGTKLIISSRNRDECANQVIKAIKAGKEEVYIGGKEKYAVLLKRYFPRIFSKIVRKAKVT